MQLNNILWRLGVFLWGEGRFFLEWNGYFWEKIFLFFCQNIKEILFFVRMFSLPFFAGRKGLHFFLFMRNENIILKYFEQGCCKKTSEEDEFISSENCCQSTADEIKDEICWTVKFAGSRTDIFSCPPSPGRVASWNFSSCEIGIQKCSFYYHWLELVMKHCKIKIQLIAKKYSCSNSQVIYNKGTLAKFSPSNNIVFKLNKLKLILNYLISL